MQRVLAFATPLFHGGRIVMERELHLRVALLLVAVAAAYHYSLLTLVRQVSVDTPLAYLGLVPLIALLLAAARCRLPSARRDIRDRTVDYIIGLPLLTAALAVILVAPIRLSLLFWLWRIDLLTLPLFVAGAVAILFGVRALWRARLSILFLLLAWPVPYTLLVNGQLSTLTGATVAALDRVAALLPFARPIGAGDGSIFLIAHGGQPFLLSVGSACAGANGILGFLLVAVAFAALLSGPLPLKVLWLAAGVALTWTLNLCRIVLIFAVGQAFGEDAAVRGLHPFVGLITFSAGVALMAAAVHLFRLRVPDLQRVLPRSGPAEAGPAPGSHRAGGPWTAPFPLTGMALVLASAGLLASANASLQHVQLVAHDLGAPRVQEMSGRDPGVDGWSLDQIDSYTWADQYFGSGATWVRYEYEMQASRGATALVYQSPVVMDVVTTNDLAMFSTYPVETCYRYRGARILQTRTVDLGSGVVGHAISSRAGGVTWSSVYWEWPVHTASGVRYERVVLTTSATGSSGAPGPAPPDITQGLGLARSIGVLISDGLGDAEGAAARGPVASSQSFLVAFAHAIVQSDATSSNGSPRGQPRSQQSIARGGA